MRTAGPFRRRRGGASPTSSRPATPTEWLALWLLCFAYRLSGRRHRPGRGSGQPRRRSGGRDTQSSVGDVRGRPAAVVACHPASPRAACARARLVSRDVPASRGPRGATNTCKAVRHVERARLRRLRRPSSAVAPSARRLDRAGPWQGGSRSPRRALAAGDRHERAEARPRTELCGGSSAFCGPVIHRRISAGRRAERGSENPRNVSGGDTHLLIFRSAHHPGEAVCGKPKNRSARWP